MKLSIATIVISISIPNSIQSNPIQKENERQILLRSQYLEILTTMYLEWSQYLEILTTMYLLRLVLFLIFSHN
jgi:hypothetical protein